MNIQRTSFNYQANNRVNKQSFGNASNSAKNVINKTSTKVGNAVEDGVERYIAIARELARTQDIPKPGPRFGWQLRD